jgi:hypothetical protein
MLLTKARTELREHETKSAIDQHPGCISGLIKSRQVAKKRAKVQIPISYPTQTVARTSWNDKALLRHFQALSKYIN